MRCSIASLAEARADITQTCVLFLTSSLSGVTLITQVCVIKGGSYVAKYAAHCCARDAGTDLAAGQRGQRRKVIKRSACRDLEDRFGEQHAPRRQHKTNFWCPSEGNRRLRCARKHRHYSYAV